MNIYILIIFIPLIFILCAQCGLFIGGNKLKKSQNEIKLEKNIKLYEKKIDKLKLDLTKINEQEKINILLKEIDKNTIVKNDYLIQLNQLKISKLKGGNKCSKEFKIITKQKDKIISLKDKVQKIKMELKTEKSIKKDLQKKNQKAGRKLKKARQNIDILNNPLSVFSNLIS